MDQATAQNTFELREVRGRIEASRDAYVTPEQGEEIAEDGGQSLPPYDGGKVAWRLLLAMFVFEALLWG